MKIFGVTLFLVGFAVMSDPAVSDLAASDTNGLWNGGKILPMTVNNTYQVNLKN